MTPPRRSAAPRRLDLFCFRWLQNTGLARSTAFTPVECRPPGQPHLSPLTMFFLLLLLTTLQPTTTTTPCQARLEIQQQDGLLTVISHCRNLLPTAGRYRYELSLVRLGTGGRSQNMQRGEFDVAPEQEVSLSQSRINVGPQDTYRIHLRVLDITGHIISQDSASQGSAR